MGNELEPDSRGGNSLLGTVRSGFIVWSWVALLGAYLSTSALLINQAHSLLREGIGYDYGWPVLMISVFTTYLPMLVVVIGWIIFFRYSREMYRHAIVSDAGSPNQSSFLFERSLRYLVLGWLVALLGSVVPVVLVLTFNR